MKKAINQKSKTFLSISVLIFSAFFGFTPKTQAAQPAPILSISISSSTDSLTSNSPVSYTVTFENKGNAKAENVRIAMTLPQQLSYISDTSKVPAGANALGITWPIGTMEAGAKKSFQINAFASETTAASVEKIHVITIINTSTTQTDKSANAASIDVLLYPTPSLS
ncbi:MAG TPA: hypothetical protein VF817_01035 [Patescibacteria group bacterium]